MSTSTIEPFRLVAPFTAIATLADALLTCFPHDGTYGEGWEWIAQGTSDPKIYSSMDMNSEKHPYPTLEAAISACLNFYARTWHGDYQDVL